MSVLMFGAMVASITGCGHYEEDDYPATDRLRVFITDDVVPSDEVVTVTIDWRGERPKSRCVSLAIIGGDAIFALPDSPTHPGGEHDQGVVQAPTDGSVSVRALEMFLHRDGRRTVHVESGVPQHITLLASLHAGPQCTSEVVYDVSRSIRFVVDDEGADDDGIADLGTRDADVDPIDAGTIVEDMGQDQGEVLDSGSDQDGGQL